MTEDQRYQLGQALAEALRENKFRDGIRLLALLPIMEGKLWLARAVIGEVAEHEKIHVHDPDLVSGVGPTARIALNMAIENGKTLQRALRMPVDHPLFRDI